MTKRFVVKKDAEPVPLVLPLDQATLQWLTHLSGGNDTVAAEIIASMLRDIRVDDEAMHETRH
jgi:hypothetical protein